ncbi:hypothetical protein ACFL5K_05765, partial [Gemmatimonadota bacterium]
GIRAVAEVAERVIEAREAGRPVIMAFGAHTIKNGLAPVLISLIEKGWVSHLATNGAGIIHDWEIAYQGMTSEDVKGGVQRGEFGNWQETGYYINLALNVGSYEGKGYGEAVGAMIERGAVEVPSACALEKEVIKNLKTDPERAAAAAELLAVVRRFKIPSGKIEVEHRWKNYSIQAAAFRLGVPFTGHPMFGHDIIYNHPLNHGASLGRAAERDFLTFARNVSNLSSGVYLSVGSAVMSPMVFEKSMSMAQNLALQESRRIEGHYLMVADLARSSWDWNGGEPPEDSPDYYLRYNKSFSRMGGTMRYLSADNRAFLPALHRELSCQQDRRKKG